MPVFDHFEILSPYYDRIFKGDSPDRIVQLADLPTSGILLDAGGGTGRISEQLIGMAGTLIIADSSIGMLRQASRKNGLNAVHARTENLPFMAESIDRVIMVDALHHVFNQQSTLQELWRIVKPGGKIVIEEPDVRNFFVKILAVVEKLLLMRSRFISPIRIATLLTFPDSRVSIEGERYKTWVIMEKIVR